MVDNLAGVGKRVLGAIIDIIVIMIISMFFAKFFGETDGLSFSVSGAPAMVLFAIVFLYFVVLEGATGRTIGKYIVKTQVVNETGESLSWGQSIARNLLRIVDSFAFYLVGFIAVLASKNNQRIGDMASGTYVINVKKA